MDGQEPCSVIVCCSDSRVPPEIVLGETNLGRLFVVRTAGESLDSCAIESIEYALSKLHVSQIIVLGHEDCGAVAAVYEAVAEKKACKDTGIPCICRHIRPAIVSCPSQTRKQNIVASIKRNVILTARRIVDSTTADPDIVHGAYYHLKSGKVRWLRRRKKSKQQSS